MGTKRRILLYVVFAVIVLAIVLFPSSLPTSLPVYQGRTIDAWYADYAVTENPPGVRARAEQVLCEMGTNWTPALIKRLSDVHDSKIKLKMLALLNSQSWIKFSYSTAEKRREAALLEFVYWGPGTAAAKSELLRLTKDANASVAAIALRAFGIAIAYEDHPAIEPLIQATTHANDFVRQTVFLEISSIYLVWHDRHPASGPETFPRDKITTALLTGVNDPNLQIRLQCVDEIGRSQAAPERSIPLLAGLLQNTNSSMRFAAARALKNFGAAAWPAVPALKAVLQDSDKGVSGQAAMTLNEIMLKSAPSKAGEIPEPAR